MAFKKTAGKTIVKTANIDLGPKSVTASSLDISKWVYYSMDFNTNVDHCASMLPGCQSLAISLVKLTDEKGNFVLLNVCKSCLNSIVSKLKMKND